LGNLASAERAGDLNAFLTSNAFETPVERSYRNRLCALLHGRERLSTADLVKLVPARSLAQLSNDILTPEQSQQVHDFVSQSLEARLKAMNIRDSDVVESTLLFANFASGMVSREHDQEESEGEQSGVLSD